jgi:hypothetical protein
LLARVFRLASASLLSLKNGLRKLFDFWPQYPQPLPSRGLLQLRQGSASSLSAGGLSIAKHYALGSEGQIFPFYRMGEKHLNDLLAGIQLRHRFSPEKVC